jgi:soluble lytic murein transglycosylase-like protein
VATIFGADPGVLINTPEREQIAEWVRGLAPIYGLDPNLILAIIKTESNFDPLARSPKNALGLMQLIPSTAARFGVKERSDPVQNLHGGMAYMRWLLSYFNGDLRLSLAGYNAGEGAVERYRGVPPYRETRQYIDKVMKAYGRTEHPEIDPVVDPTAKTFTVE